MRNRLRGFLMAQPQGGMKEMMKVIGVTGGVGAGKSSILSFLSDNYKCRVLRSDEAAHEMLLPASPVYGQLKDLLEDAGGEGELLDPDGAINKKEMAARIFADPGLLSRVNGLIHPAVREYILSEIRKEREKGEIDYFFLEAALLIEGGYGSVVDEMWYIYADPETRKKRLRDGRGYTQEKTDSIMASQLSEEEFRKGSDFVVDNSGDLEEAVRQIESRLAGGKT